MNREEAHKLVDELFNAKESEKPSEALPPTPVEAAVPTPPQPAPAVPNTPKDKRVVRTKSSGDRVYLLDEIKKTRQWLFNPEVLDSTGFTMGDVVEIEDSELLKYGMGAAILKPIEKDATA